MTATLPPPPSAPPPPTLPSAPTKPPRDLSFATAGAVAALVAASIAFDLAINSELDGWAALAMVTLIVVALAASGRMRSKAALAVATAALAPALFLGLRASPWLLTLDVLAIIGLLAIGGARATGGSLLDTRFSTLARQGGSLVASAILAPAAFVQSVAGLNTPGPTTGPHRGIGPLARGLALTLPIVAVLGTTLASGDAVFASFVRFDAVLDNSATHLAGIFVGLWAAAAILTQATRSRPERPAGRRPLVGPLEGALVLGGLIAVYALFAVARLMVALGGDKYVLETTGLTYAAYARNGFFQLLGAAALTVLVLLGLRSAVDLPTVANRRVFAGLTIAAVALTLVMVHSATIRLGLYDGVFGLTVLRLYSTIFAWWVGAVLVLVGLSLCGVYPRRSWLPAFVAGSALLTLVIVNVMNPERLIMSRNLDRQHEIGRFDLEHALELSDDGLTTLIERRGELPDWQQAALHSALCEVSGRPDPGPSWNVSVRAANSARAELCATN
jgi:hypothetical protein